MIQPSGIAQGGRAYVYGTSADFSPIAEGKRQEMLRRSLAAQERLRREQATNSMTPEVSGDVFYGDIPGLREKANNLVSIQAQIRAQGVDPTDTSNPLVQQFTQDLLDFRYAEGQSKQRQQNLQTKTNGYQQALVNDKALPGWEDELSQYMANYVPLQEQGIPSYSGFENFDMFSFINQVGNAIEDEKTSELYRDGILFGEKTITGKNEESITLAADQAMGNQKFQRAASRGYSQLDQASQADVALRASQSGIPVEQQYSRDLFMQSLGGKREDRTISQTSSSTLKMWNERRDQKVLGEAVLKQLAGAMSGQDVQGPGEGNPLFQGVRFGDTGETVKYITNTGDDGRLLVVTDTGEEDYDGRPITKARRFSRDQVFSQFLTPVIEGLYEGDADQVMETIYQEYKALGGDLGSFDPALINGEQPAPAPAPALNRFAPSAGQTTSSTSVTATSRYGN